MSIRCKGYSTSINSTGSFMNILLLKEGLYFWKLSYKKTLSTTTLSTTTLSTTTLSIITLSIITLSINGLFATLRMIDTQLSNTMPLC
jgi:hypothetical protein